MKILEKIDEKLNEGGRTGGNKGPTDYNKKQIKKILKHLLKSQDEIGTAAMEAAKLDVKKPYLSIKIQKNQILDGTGDMQDIINDLVKNLKKLFTPGRP